MPLLLLLLAMPVMGQSLRPAFKPGEWLKFRIHYGFLNASYATMHLTSSKLDEVPVYHVVGKGKTTGFASIFLRSMIPMKVILTPNMANLISLFERSMKVDTPRI